MRRRIALLLAAGVVVAAGASCNSKQASKIQETPTPESKPVPESNAPAPPAAKVDDTPSSEAAYAAAKRLVALIIRGERHEAYESFHSKWRATVTEAQLAASLDVMDAAYGKVQEAQVKQEFVGSEQSAVLGTHGVREYTFAVTTTKHPKGTHFAVVAISTDGDHAAPESYKLITFEGEIPPNLR